MSTTARLIKFGIVGASGVVVNQGTLLLLGELTPLSLLLRSLLAIEMAIVTNFLLNLHWTWRDRRAETAGGMAVQFLRFNLSSGGTAYLLNHLPLLWLVSLGWPEGASNLLGIGIAAGGNFLLSHFWTFKKSDAPTQ